MCLENRSVSMHSQETLSISLGAVGSYSVTFLPVSNVETE